MRSPFLSAISKQVQINNSTATQPDLRVTKVVARFKTVKMNYWLAPSGKVWCEEKIGSHYERALTIIDEKFDYILDENGILSHKIDAVEFLESKGFIRYMDWSNKPRWIIYNQKPTRQQIRKMFDLTGFAFS